MVGIGAWNMLIRILIACGIVGLLLIMFVAPGRPVAAHEEIHHHALDLNLLLCLQLLMQGAQRDQSGEADRRDAFGGKVNH